MTGAQLLVVSNETLYRDNAAEYLQLAGHYVVAQAGTTPEALRHLTQENHEGFDFSAVIFPQYSTAEGSRKPQDIDHPAIVSHMRRQAWQSPVLFHESIPPEHFKVPYFRAISFSGYLALIKALERA